MAGIKQEIDMEEDFTQEQHKISKQPEHLKKFSFKKGQSGNPGGRPVGSKSMKTFAREYLEQMDDDERVEFLNAMDPKIVWEMSEGKAKQDLDVQGEIVSKVIRLDIE